MKYFTLFILLLAILFQLNACSKQNSSPPQGGGTVNAQRIMKHYFDFISRYDSSGMQNIKIDITNPDANQASYKVVNELLTEAEPLYLEMQNEANTNPDINAQILIKPYLTTMAARVAVLKTNKATLESYGT